MTLCIFKPVAISFVRWVYHPSSEEAMELLLILACQLKLREKPISSYLGGGREGCKPDWWYLGCLILQRLPPGESVKVWIWLTKSWGPWLFCFRHGSASPFPVAHPAWSCWIFLNDRRKRRRGRRSRRSGGGSWRSLWGHSVLQWTSWILDRSGPLTLLGTLWWVFSYLLKPFEGKVAWWGLRLLCYGGLHENLCWG